MAAFVCESASMLPLVRMPDPGRHSALHGSEGAVRSLPEGLAGKTADDKGKEGPDG